MEQYNLISIQKYAIKNRCSTFAIIKKINAGQLNSIKKDGLVYIVDDSKSDKTDTHGAQMRRNEFSVEDREILMEILHSCEYGTLCLLDGEKPYGVPLNFAWHEDCIVFHGANEGKKIELIDKNPNALFNVVKPYSFIPSYYSGTKSACSATHFFASITIEGMVNKINDLPQKASALNALMEKMQPEKKYETIDASNPIYKKMVEKTAVFMLEVFSISTKIKAGQNLTEEKKESLMNQLRERGSKVDLATIELMKTYKGA